MKSTRRRPVSVPATEAAKNFGRLIDRVRETRTTYIVERGGRPVASIAPMERDVFTMRDLKALVAHADRRASADYLDAVERASARRNRPRVRRNPWGR
jgi:antitoxin (DNA-binding transcriptional repressor) of toxin-antitoxin stability system